MTQAQIKKEMQTEFDECLAAMVGADTLDAMLMLTGAAIEVNKLMHNFDFIQRKQFLENLGHIERIASVTTEVVANE